MMDADGSYQWPDVENVIEALESGAEAVTGVRPRAYSPGGHEPPTPYGQSCVGNVREHKEQKKDTRPMLWVMGFH